MLRGKGPVYRLKRGDKALMIDAVLADHLGAAVRGHRILDIGSGNGDISQHFASAGNEQYGVDVADRRRAQNAGFTFCTVTDETLPFDDRWFDIVISNHVIEHVADQSRHLAEIRRVLRPGGCVYLATPNRSSPILPGHKGNEQVLRYRDMRPLFERHGFAVREYSLELVRDPGRFHGDMPRLGWLPGALLRALRVWFPSHVFVLSPTQQAPAEALVNT